MMDQNESSSRIDPCSVVRAVCVYACRRPCSYVLKQPGGAQPFLWLSYKHPLNFSWMLHSWTWFWHIYVSIWMRCRKYYSEDAALAAAYRRLCCPKSLLALLAFFRVLTSSLTALIIYRSEGNRSFLHHVLHLWLVLIKPSFWSTDDLIWIVPCFTLWLYIHSSV